MNTELRLSLYLSTTAFSGKISSVLASNSINLSESLADNILSARLFPKTNVTTVWPSSNTYRIIVLTHRLVRRFGYNFAIGVCGLAVVVGVSFVYHHHHPYPLYRWLSLFCAAQNLLYFCWNNWYRFVYYHHYCVMLHQELSCWWFLCTFTTI